MGKHRGKKGHPTLLTSARLCDEVRTTEGRIYLGDGPMGPGMKVPPVPAYRDSGMQGDGANPLAANGPWSGKYINTTQHP